MLLRQYACEDFRSEITFTKNSNHAKILRYGYFQIFFVG